jgi:hypothetical protein
MPFKSKAQRRKFAELLVKGEISEETYEEWNRSTGGISLPERVHPRRASKAKVKKAKRVRPGKTARTKTKAKAKRRKH